MYVLFAALAVSCFSIHRFPLWRRLTKPSAPLQQIISNSAVIAAISDFVARYAIHMAVFRMLASTGICIAYVYSTYIGRISTVLLYSQKFLGIVLALQFVGKMLTSPRPVSFVLHGESIMEVFSLASLIMAKPTDWLNFSFLQAYIILARYFQIEPALELVFMEKTSPFHRQLTRLTLEFIVFIYVFASGLQLFERLGDPWQTLTATTFELTLANSFYFTVVTIFTVGYGDFVPYTLMGRLWIIFIIVFGAYLVSRKIGQVVDVVSGLRRGLGSFVKAENVDHCVICGNVKWEYLKSFVQEFYGDGRNTAKKLVVICDKPNWTEDTWNKFFTAHAKFRNNVVYLEGSCVSRDDLVRAQVDDAKAVFVLNNQHNPDPYAEDSETLKRILTIRSYAPNLPIYSMCALRDSMLQITYALEHVDEIEAEDSMSRRGSMPAGISMIAQEGRRAQSDILGTGAFGNDGTLHPASAYYSGDYEEDEEDDDGDDGDGLLVPNYDGSSDLKSEAICMQEVEMSLLAENVFCNGLSTLLANLILRVIPQTKPSDQPWAIEYKIGSECRFEYVKLPMQLHDRKFSEIAMIMYDFGVLLIATKRFMDKKWKAITPDTSIHLNTIGLIITFHSATFLDHIMQHIAKLVGDMFDEVVSEASSQDVPSMEDDFSDEVGVPRYNIAGDLLTGDVSLAYEYGADEYVTPPSEFLTTGTSWNAPRTLDTIFKASEREPISDPRSLPESAIPVGPLSGMQAQDTANPLIFARTIASEQRLGVSVVDSNAPGRHSELEKTLPKPSLRFRSLRLDIPQIEASLQADSSDEGPDSNLSRPLPTPDTSSASNVTDGDMEVVANQFRSSNVGAEGAEDLGIQQIEVDQALDSEEAPVSAMKASFHPSAKRAANKSKQRVSFNSGEASNSKRQKRSALLSKNDDEGQPFIFFGDDELPMKLKSHIVVCTIGQMAMMNLKKFIERVWITRGPSSRDTPVVAICPRVTEEDEADLSRYSSGRLFLIQGNSLSVKTLKRAQFDQAKAIVILACEDKNDVDHMDAKAIFTVMTLDYLLGERSETFVCTMLDAEESMQLLRAPAHARRRGADLGQDADPFLEFGISASISRGGFSRLRSSQSGQFRNRGEGGLGDFDSKRSIGERTFSFGAISAAGDLPRSMSFVGIRNSTYTNRRAAIEKRLGIRDTTAYTSGRKMSLHSYGAYGNTGDEEDDLMNNPSMGGASALNFLMNPSTITMGAGQGLSLADTVLGRGRGLQGATSNVARDESFEKQRYASGEMMISSTYMSLLIREYAMPGLMAVVRKIFGAGMGKQTKSKRCWIRTVHIPHKWIMGGEGGRRIYREVVETLLDHKAIAIGLYRSGDVAVRVQFEPDPEMDERRSEGSSSGRRYSDSFADGSGTTPHADEFDSPNASDVEIPGLELGGDSVPRLKTSRSFERTAILQNLPSYGTMQDNGGDAEAFSGQDPDAGDQSDDRSARVDIPASMMFDMAEDVQAAQAAQQGTGSVLSGEEPYKPYICPSSGRTAIFKEVPGGENVLPYVYTNPEAYTLVSEHDAVYVLVSPHVTIPDDWMKSREYRE